VIVLGFDTATLATVVGLRLADGTTTQARDDPPPGEHPGHATRLLGMAGELLGAAGIGWAGVDRIAVGVGPGAFTGLRVGVATARGLAQALGAELAGVSSLAALAAGAAGEAERVLAVIDARRGEIFAAAYETGDPAPRRLTEPCAIAPHELAGLVPGEGPWLAVGDGAVRYRDELAIPGVTVAAGGSPLHLVSGEAVCALGALAPAAPALELVTPDYIRRPDAEIALGAAATSAKSRHE
jgi:tRNA threonylcarbamoyladenosine biosynthesis protein TsaB